MKRLILLTSILTHATLLAGAAVAVAAQTPKPAVQRLDVTVAVQADKSAKVVAKYTVLNPEALKDATIVHQLSDMPGITVEDLKATTEDGKALEASTAKKAGFDNLMLKVASDAKSPFVYTLEYTSKASGKFRLPVFVPNFPVARSVRSFFATVTLPPKMNYYGDEFPRLQSIIQQGDNVVLEMAEVNLPSFIKVDFGQGAAPLITGSSVTTFFSFLFIIAAAYWWWYLKSRQFKTT